MALKQSDAISVQERDLALLRGLLESRVMTGGHVASIYFEGKKEAAKKRLQKLKSSGYIGERKRQPTEPAVLSLTGKGFKLLKAQGILTDYPPTSLKSMEKRSRVSDITLRHELEVMDVKAVFHAGFKGVNNYSIAEFTTWTQMHQFKAMPSSYDGDGLIHGLPDSLISNLIFENCQVTTNTGLKVDYVTDEVKANILGSGLKIEAKDSMPIIWGKNAQS